MLSCTEFIPAYNELFRFLHARGGPEAVEIYWRKLCEDYASEMQGKIKEKGLAGCFDHWAGVLQEEAADFRMTLDEENEVFTLEIRSCPSMARLLSEKHIEPYEFYCQHCAALYRPRIEPLGYNVEIDMSKCHEARCRFVIRKKH